MEEIGVVSRSFKEQNLMQIYKRWEMQIGYYDLILQNMDYYMPVDFKPRTIYISLALFTYTR